MNIANEYRMNSDKNCKNKLGFHTNSQV